jgi:hypothetical protein
VTQEGGTNYFRYYIHDMTEDLKLALTTFGGNPSVYIGMSPNKKWPSRDNQDMQAAGGSVT